MALHNQKTPKYDIYAWDGTNGQQLTDLLGVVWTYSPLIWETLSDGTLRVYSADTYFSRYIPADGYLVFGPYWSEEVDIHTTSSGITGVRYADEFEPVTEV
jgi:hypothetical protein